MEHWLAAAAAAVIAVVMVVAVIAISFRVAGPAPPYLFINHPVAQATQPR